MGTPCPIIVLGPDDVVSLLNDEVGQIVPDSVVAVGLERRTPPLGGFTVATLLLMGRNAVPVAGKSESAFLRYASTASGRYVVLASAIPDGTRSIGSFDDPFLALRDATRREGVTLVDWILTSKHRWWSLAERHSSVRAYTANSGSPG